MMLSIDWCVMVYGWFGGGLVGMWKWAGGGILRVGVPGIEWYCAWLFGVVCCLVGFVGC